MFTISKNNLFNTGNQQFNLGAELSSFINIDTTDGPSLLQQLESMFPLLQEESVQLSISQEARDAITQLEEGLNQMNADIAAARRQFRELQESMREAARMRQIKHISQQIARRIKDNQEVPHRDKIFLRENNQQLYAQALAMRSLSNEDIERYNHSLADRYTSQNRSNTDSLRVRAVSSSYGSNGSSSEPVTISVPTISISV